MLNAQQNGQNLAWHSNTPDQNIGHTLAELFMNGWANEKQYWTYGALGAAGTCSAPSTSTCFHYTASKSASLEYVKSSNENYIFFLVIWATTNKIGCAYVDCPNGITGPNGAVYSSLRKKTFKLSNLNIL